jgi:hypothetical protein
MSRFPSVLENEIRVAGEVVSLKHRPPFTLQEDFRYTFLLKADSKNKHEQRDDVPSTHTHTHTDTHTHTHIYIYIYIYRLISNLIRTIFTVSEGLKIRCGLESSAN